MIDFPASPTDGQTFVGSNGVTYKYNAANTVWISQASASGGAPLRNWFSGFVSQNTGAANKIYTVGAGQCADSTNSVLINSTTPITKTLASTWAAGTGTTVGGLAPGVTLANNTWYFPFIAIINGLVDLFVDNNISATHAPPGTTAFRRLRPIKTQTGTNLAAYMGKGDLVEWVSSYTEYATNPGAGNQTVTINCLGAPPGIQTFIQLSCFGNAGEAWVAALFAVGAVPATNANWTATFGAEANGSNGYGACFQSVLTNTSAQIQLNSSGGVTGGTAYQIYSFGFIDDCGRLD